MFGKIISSLALLTILALSAVLAVESIPTSPSKERILLRHCLAEYRQATLLGAPIAGVIQDSLVDLGDRVKAGQVLGRIQDLEQRAEMERCKYEAEHPAAVRTAESKYDLAKIRTRYAKELTQEKAVSRLEYDVLKREEETARLSLEEAKVLQRLAQLHYQQARAAVQVREIISPHDGIIVQVLKRKGEAVSVLPNDPVYRVVNPEVLRVTGYLDAVDAWRVRPGQAVRVKPETAGPALPIQEEVFSGEVVFVDREIDPRTRTCRVVAEVKNRKELLRAGLEVQMEILTETGPAAATSGR